MRLVGQYLNGAALLETSKFDDSRGSFAVPYEVKKAVEAGLPDRFVQDNHSISTVAGTLRGIHLQLPPFEQGKLVRVLRGRVIDLIVDLRSDSASFGQHELLELSAADGQQLWVPPGFGHGFCTLEDHTEVFYKVDAPYHPESERTLAWDDPVLGVDWPVSADSVVLSDKDAEGLTHDEIMQSLAAAKADVAG